MSKTDRQHMSSRKHRRFAENPENFADLDALLSMLKRPPNPATVDYDAPGVACWENHKSSVMCDMCMPLDTVECEEECGSLDEGTEDGDDNNEVSNTNTESVDEDESEEEA